MKRPNAPKKDTLICVGTLESIGPLKTTEAGNYYMQEVRIKPQGTAPKTKFNLMWAPDFFSPSFDLKLFAGDIGKKPSAVEFVYAKNLVSSEGSNALGYIEGLCGSKETFSEFDDASQQLSDYSANEVAEFIRDFFTKLGPVPIVFVLKQQRKEAGTQVDEETGKEKKIYVRGNFYEVDNIGYLDEKTLKGLVRGVEANLKNREKAEAEDREVPVRVKFTFEPSNYGFDIEVPGSEPAWAA